MEWLLFAATDFQEIHKSGSFPEFDGSNKEVLKMKKSKNNTFVVHKYKNNTFCTITARVNFDFC